MQSGFLAPFLLIVQALWLLGPGMVVGLELARRGVIAAYLVVPVAGVVGGLVGYGALWAYLANGDLGKVYSYLTLALAVAAVVLVALRPGFRSLLAKVDVSAPLVLLGLVAMFYVATTFSCTVPIQQNDYLNNACHLHTQFGDNMIPQLFADNIVAGTPKVPLWSWQTSGRPPLQTGVTLMQDPWIHGYGGRVLGYEILAVLLQVLWVPVLWAMLRALKLSGFRLVAVLTMCVFTGFFFYNSIYVWPKLIAAAMVMTAFLLMFFEKRSAWAWVIAGLAAGAGMESHSGVAFTLIPMAALVLLRRYRPQWRHLVLAGGFGLLVLVPWQLYQKLYDPPGDQLLKWHFAGVWEPTDPKDPFYRPPQSLGHLIVKGYTDPPFTWILHQKWMNVLSFVGIPDSAPIPGAGSLLYWRSQEFTFLVYGLGLFNVALLMLLVPAVRRRLGAVADVSRLKLMFAVIGLTMVAEVLIEYGPGWPASSTPAIFQGSYGLMMLLFAALGAVLTVLPKWAVAGLVALNVAYVSVVWIGFAWWPHLNHHHQFMAVAALAALALFAALWWSARRLDAAPGDDQPASPVAVPRPRHAAGSPTEVARVT